MTENSRRLTRGSAPPGTQAPDEETLALAQQLFHAAREGDTGAAAAPTWTPAPRLP